MPKFAQFLTLYHTPTLRLHGVSRTFGPFNLADLDTKTPDLRAVLAFRIRALTDVAQLTMHFNGNQSFLNYLFDPPEPDSTRPRSWHEIFQASDLQAQNNQLTVNSAGPGSIEISDIVLLYHASIP